LADPAVVSGTHRPCAVRDDVRAGQGAFDRIGVPDVCRNKISCAWPTFGPMTSDPGHIVTLAEQSGDQAAAEHTAGPGDRDSH